MQPPAPAPSRPHEIRSLLQSLQAGVVPRGGLQHLAVGRVAELRQALAELQVLRAGGGVFKVLCGDYGSGKTFFLSLLRQVALAQGFLVADADLGPELRLRGEGRGLATYRQLTARLASDARPEGGALELLLDRWADRVRQGARARLPQDAPDQRSPALATAVDRELRARLAPIEAQPEGFAFAAVLRRAYEAALAGDADLAAGALRFLRGECRSATEARAGLRLPGLVPPSDDTWYAHLRLLALLAVQAGHAGLVVQLDEGVNLLRISSPEARAANYEVLLRLCNDALQGRAPHLAFQLAGPPELLSDSRRGLFSYPALRSRLATNPFADERHRDLAQPVLRLDPLSADELLALWLKVRDLHASCYGTSGVSDDEAAGLLGRLLSRPGAERFLTVREAVRCFVQALNVLAQNPGMDHAAVLGGVEQQVAELQLVEIDGGDPAGP